MLRVGPYKVEWEHDRGLKTCECLISLADTTGFYKIAYASAFCHDQEEYVESAMELMALWKALKNWEVTGIEPLMNKFWQAYVEMRGGKW